MITLAAPQSSAQGAGTDHVTREADSLPNVLLTGWTEGNEAWIEVRNPMRDDLDLRFIDRELIPFARQLLAADSGVELDVVEYHGAGETTELAVLRIEQTGAHSAA